MTMLIRSFGDELCKLADWDSPRRRWERAQRAPRRRKQRRKEVLSRVLPMRTSTAWDPGYRPRQELRRHQMLELTKRMEPKIEKKKPRAAMEPPRMTFDPRLGQR